MSEMLRLMPIRTFALPKINGPLPFDLYVQLGQDQSTKVFNAQDPLELARFESYVLKGIRHFYIPENQRQLFLNAGVDILREIKRTNGFDSEDAQQILDEVTEQCLLDIYGKMQLTPDTDKALKLVVQSYVDITNNQKHLLPALLTLARKKPEMSKHAIMTSLFSSLLAQAHDPENTDLAYICAYAGILHDIGFSLLKTTDDEHKIGLPPNVRSEIQKHPGLGAQIVGKVPGFPSEVRTAILQHHEGYDGSGYPAGLEKEMISLPARIVAIAEDFVSLITGAGQNFPLPPNLAVHALSRNARLDPYLHSTLTRLLKF